MQADVLVKIILPLSLFFIMFGLGLSLRLADFKNVVNSPKPVLVGIIGQMLLLPLIAFMIAVLLGLPAEIAVGLMIIALAPGGATSNVFTYLYKGDVPLSISLTAVVSLVTPFTIPLVTVLSMAYFLGDQTQFTLPLLDTIKKLLIITVLPVALGMFVLSRWPNVSAKLGQVLKWFSILFLALIIVLIVLKNKDDMLGYFAQAGIATLLLCGIAVLLGYFLAKFANLTPAQRTCLGFEVGIQNGTLALLVAGTLLGNSTMMIPAVTYSLIMFVVAVLFGMWVKRLH